jgi:Putative endonuclease segE, GIY-YIG domain
MWLLNAKEFKEVPVDCVGFIYRITLLVDTKDYPKGSIYIGKKIFNFKKKSKLSKKAQIQSGTRKRVKIESKSSDWEKYYGSSLELKALVKEIGEHNFHREILHLCNSKAEMSYMELVEQIKQEVFHVPSFNKWISCRIYRTSLNKK